MVEEINNGQEYILGFLVKSGPNKGRYRFHVQEPAGSENGERSLSKYHTRATTFKTFKDVTQERSTALAGSAMQWQIFKTNPLAIVQELIPELEEVNNI